VNVLAIVWGASAAGEEHVDRTAAWLCELLVVGGAEIGATA
jgi:hypothetical protein